MVFFYAYAFITASLLFSKNAHDVHAQKEQKNSVEVSPQRTNDYYESPEMNEEMKGYHYYSACNSCLEIDSFGDFDSLIIDDQKEHVLYLCGWKGSLTWPSEIEYTFANTGTVFVMNCCGPSCAFNGRGEESRALPILRFDGGTIEQVEVNGFTFEDIESDTTFIEFDQSVGYFDFHNNVLKNVEALMSVILFTSGAFGAVVRMNNNVVMGSNTESGILRIAGGGADVTLRSNKFTDNRALRNGGVMNIVDSTLHLFYNYFDGNTAGNRVLDCKRRRRKLLNTGKNVIINKSNHKISRQIVDENLVHRREHDNSVGGDRHLQDDATNISSGDGDDLTAAGNLDTPSGGVLLANDVVIYSEGNKFINNYAERAAGAIGASGICLQSTKDIFVNNIAQCSSGGAIGAGSGSIEIKNALFKNNTAEDVFGGAIYMEDICAEITYSTFEDNISRIGGGAVVLQQGGSIVSKANRYINNKVTFVDEKVGGNGGALDTTNGRLESMHDLFKGNMAEGFGGAVHVRSNAHLIKSAKFIRNMGKRGGGLRCEGAVCTVKDSLFQDNNATMTDGGNDISVKNSFLKECDNTFFPEMSINNEEEDKGDEASSIIYFTCDNYAEHEL